MPTLRTDQLRDLGRLLFTDRKTIHGGEPGTGKTPTVCVLQKARWHQHQHKSVWTMPMKLIDKNYDEAMLWGQWAPGEVAVVDGSAAKCAAIIADPNVKLLIMGFARFELVWEQISLEYKAIDIDEWHKGHGGHDSKRTQALYKWCALRGSDLWFVPMTGSIYNGRPATIYPALQIIEPRYYGTLDAFKMMHDIVDPWTGKVTGHCELPRLQQILEKHSIKRLWTDVHGPEEIVTEIARVPMNKRQRAAYDTFRDQAILELENFFIDGTQPGVAFIRSRQIMEHPNRFPNLIEGEGGHVDICPGERPGKLDLFELDCEEMTRLGRPMLAYAATVPQQWEMLDVANKAGRRTVILNGSTTDRETSQADKGFISGQFDTIIASPKVADCGFNWQYCNQREVQDVFFVSMDYQDTAFFQAYKRAMRGKRGSALRIKISTYLDSIDQHIMRLTKRKSVDAAQVERGRVPLPW